MKNLFLFEIYPNGSENESSEYHDYWAESIDQATKKMRDQFPAALILNKFEAI